MAQTGSQAIMSREAKAAWVIAGLRHEQFTSLAQLRLRIREQIDAYNREPFQKRDGSRLSVFTAEEKPLLQALPAAPFEISTWVYKRKVNANAHVVWAKNFYSVPFSHIGALVDLRVTETMLEVYRRDERLTSHLLLPATASNQYRTNEADLPEGAASRPGTGPDRGVGGAGRTCDGGSDSQDLRDRVHR
ncbi:putative transposase y4bL/y4kJ/y4tB [Arthrobacter sp. Hiyo4]|nr:putative transposase y4bL/y4kJ/y4tB [Arthrobacter sp. Hiyo4]